ncbi:MAG: zinc-ribbon domain-containing protein [Candidatus Bathyarchaeia archaeon]
MGLLAKEKLVCPACGREVQEDQTFCPYCGKKL